jgi:uncharacterized membrane protein YfcA
MNLVTTLELLGVGIGAGILGSLIGLGGGFVVIPVLRLLYGVSPSLTAGASLVMVLANGISGSIAYIRQGRADVRLALLTAVTGVPACIVGAIAVRHVSFAGFDTVYGAMLVLFFIDVMRRANRTGPPTLRFPGTTQRTLVDKSGETFTYGFNPWLVLVSGLAIGFIASFFGIGGGIVFLVVFIAAFGMPAHIVTATSLVSMLFIAPVGVVTHWLQGDIDWTYALPIAIGGLAGGQLGPQIARRLSSPQLLRVLAFAVLATALSLIGTHLLAR